MKLSLMLIFTLVFSVLSLNFVNVAKAETDDETVESSEGDAYVPVYDSSEEGSVDDSSVDVEE